MTTERKTAYTPGPWMAELPSEPNHFFSTVAAGVISNGTYRPLAGVSDGRVNELKDRDEGIANACLMAAAPELLEALQRATKWITDWCKSEDDALVIACRAAIAKATGLRERA